MSNSEDQDELLDHLQRITGLERATLGKVVAETLGFFAESLDDFVARRHAALRTRGLRNEEIFARIGDEARGRRFAAPALSERQIRRLIYG